MSAPLLFDRALLRKRLHRAAATLPQADFLRRRAAEDLVWRLEGVQRDFLLAVELGARDDAFGSALQASEAAGRVGALVPADLHARHRGGVVFDEERLPFARASLDLVVSILALHWTNDLPGVLSQARRALKPDRLFLATLLGGATLFELRHALMDAEIDVRGGAASRVAPALDPRDAAGLLQRAGFILPTADVDRVVVTYESPLRLLADLRAMGETAPLVDRAPLPLSRAILARFCEVYAREFGTADGRVQATFELVTMTGWTPA